MNDLLQFCAGNAEAANWLAQWQAYVHGIDDQIDGDVPADERVEHLLQLFAGAVELYTHPFFCRHAARLAPLIVSVTSTYADSVAFDASTAAWKRQWADHYRHCGAEVALLVAYLCGGYAHLRRVAPELRSQCHWLHHGPDGNSK